MRRHKPLLYWLTGKTNNVTFLDLLKFTFSPPFRFLGKRKLKSLVHDDGYLRAEFHGFERAIYWPEDFPLTSLYQVATELLYKNWWNYEIPENLVSDGDCVVDCGAAEGAFSLQVAKKCKKVYAIEPSSRFVRAMQKTFDQTPNVEILPIAVGETKGRMKLTTDGIMSQMSSSDGVQVEVDTLDNLFYHKNIEVDFIKADLEGFEVSMLKGAEFTIKKWKPSLAITTYHFREDYQKTFDLITSMCPEYKIKGVGITDQFGTPVMLHAWVNDRHP